MVDPKKTRSRSHTREAILEAACTVLVEKGLEALTLDAVAREAEVSKGGLLYHFPNKDALMLGLVNYLADGFERDLQAEFEQDDAPGTPGQWTRAYIQATLRFDKQRFALIVSLLNAAAKIPSLLEVVQEHEMRWQQRMQSDSLNPVRATIAQLAIDGLWFNEVLEMGLDEPLRTQVIEALMTMTREPN
ncbi:MAG: TetR/AcrR family transcriptional regulator [Leptolyngbyaceae cyanobacterium RU_5_1]|nr:TetR/AcrR family transcriptional regulator [Leptolyngbyaceae cyanobacterium RU_5_1]